MFLYLFIPWYQLFPLYGRLDIDISLIMYFKTSLYSFVELKSQNVAVIISPPELIFGFHTIVQTKLIPHLSSNVRFVRFM